MTEHTDLSIKQPIPQETAIRDAEASPEVDLRAERALRWRLDLGFLTIGFLGYMFKYIDQTNIVCLRRTRKTVSSTNEKF